MPIEAPYIPYLITGIFAMTIIAIVSIIVIHSYIKSKNHTILFYIGFFLLLEFWAIGTTFYPIMGSVEAATVLGMYAITASYIGFYFLLIFLELINFDRISVSRAVFLGQW